MNTVINLKSTIVILEPADARYRPKKYIMSTNFVKCGKPSLMKKHYTSIYFFT